MTKATVIDELISGWDRLIKDAEAEKSAEEQDAQETGERPDLWEWSVFLDLETARVTHAALTAMREAAQFLCDRLDEFELTEGDADGMIRDYMGHVEPAHERLKMVLAKTFENEGAA